MWLGYLKKPNTMRFISYLKKRNFTIEYLHTSGHANVDTLQKLVEAINPKYVVPIHTFSGGEYQRIFSKPVIELKGGQTQLL